MKKHFLAAFIILIFSVLFFSSCGNKPKYFRYDVSNYVSYIEDRVGIKRESDLECLFDYDKFRKEVLLLLNECPFSVSIPYISADGTKEARNKRKEIRQ